jgi:very-short-patch-repair endonuclease
MMETLTRLKEIYEHSKEAASTKFSVQQMIGELIEDMPLPEVKKVVVKKDGSQFTAPGNIVWEYEADPDYLTTITI